MAEDIVRINTDSPITKGRVIINPAGSTGSGINYSYNSDQNYKENDPPIGDIESKYDDRWDNPTYYGG